MGWGERVRNKAAGTSSKVVLKTRQLPLPRSPGTPLAKAECIIWNGAPRPAGGSRVKRLTWLNGQDGPTSKEGFWHSHSLSEKSSPFSFF